MVVGVTGTLEQMLLLATGILCSRLVTEHTLHRQTLDATGQQMWQRGRAEVACVGMRYSLYRQASGETR